MLPEASLPVVLSSLRQGDAATVVDIDDHASAAQIARLASRGLVPGANLQVLRSGDPMLVLCDDSRWALTRADAAGIHVRCGKASLARRLRSLLLP